MRRILCFLQGLVLVLFLLGCSEPIQPPLRIGTNVWPGYEPLYLARELGFLTRENAHLVEYASATQVIRAFRNETIDVAALTLDEVLLLAQDGFAPRIVLVMDASAGGDAIIAQGDIQTMQDLRGKRVGVENTALGSYVLARALELHQMYVSDLRIIPMDVNEHEARFLDGSVEAVVTFDPVRSRLLSRGGRPLFDSKQIPGEILDVLVVRDSVLESRSDSVRALLNGWFQALEFFADKSDEAAAIMAKRLALSPKDVLASYQGLLLPGREENLKMLAYDGSQPPPVQVTTLRLIDFMERKKLLKPTVQASDLFVAPLL